MQWEKGTRQKYRGHKTGYLLQLSGVVQNIVVQKIWQKADKVQAKKNNKKKTRSSTEGTRAKYTRKLEHGGYRDNLENMGRIGRV